MKWLLLVSSCSRRSTPLAQGPSEPRLTCERGPFGTKTYGGYPWDIYGCSDNRSVAVVTARGNPGMPFYFLFAEKNGQYQLSGEGTGRPEFTRKAYDDLRRLSPQDIQALVKETLKAGRASRAPVSERADAPSSASSQPTARVATPSSGGRRTPAASRAGS